MISKKELAVSVRNMGLLALFITAVILVMAANAQDKPQVKASPTPIPTEKKEPPSTAIIPAATVKEIEALRKDVELARLQIENIQLKIQQAQSELAKLQESQKKANDAVNAAVTEAATKVNIPTDKLVEYDVMGAPDGAWILKKKAADKPPATK